MTKNAKLAARAYRNMSEILLANHNGYTERCLGEHATDILSELLRAPYCPIVDAALTTYRAFLDANGYDYVAKRMP